MPVRPALDLALELAGAPMLVTPLRRQAVAADVLDLIRIVADCPDTCRAAAERTGRPIGEIKSAAQLYLQQVVLFPTSDSHRTLGVSPDAPRHVVRAHMAWLLKWLHPDHNPPDWASPYYARVMSAWHHLESGTSRDPASPAKIPRAGAAARVGRVPVRPRAVSRVPWIARPLGRSERSRRARDLVRPILVLAIVLAGLVVPDPGWQRSPATDRKTQPTAIHGIVGLGRPDHPLGRVPERTPRPAADSSEKGI
jgi:hypothetical protein